MYYQWSHAVALEATARDTLDVVGRETGVGLYLNYLMGLVWLADVIWWWRNPQSYRDRSPAVTWTVHAFFFFMVFNGTVVFGQGPVRWLGVAISLLLAASLVTSRRWRTVAS